MAPRALARPLHLRGLLLGLAAVLALSLPGAPAWALGAAAPPIVNSHAVWKTTHTTDALAFPDATDGLPQLLASIAIELPGGTVPASVASVTVQVPGEVTPRPLALARRDFFQTDYALNLTRAGVAGFPTGTYTFTVTDTAGGVTTEQTVISSFAALVPTSSLTVSGAVLSQSGPTPANVYLLDLVANPRPTISWAAVAGANHYRLRVRHVGGGYEIFDHKVPGTTTSVQLPLGRLSPGRRYEVRLEALDGPSLEASTALGAREIDVLTQGPLIQLTILGGTGAGQTLTIRARITNTGPTLNLNVVGRIHVPGGGVATFASANNIAIQSNPNGLDFFNGPIFSHTFGASEPDGVYQVELKFTDTATGDEVAVVTKTFVR